MRLPMQLFALPAGLLLLITTSPARVFAQELQWPYNLPPHVKYYPEDEPLIRRGIEIQQRLQKQPAAGVRKMSDDPGEMFFLDYWSFAPLGHGNSTTSCRESPGQAHQLRPRPGNNTLPVSFEQPFPLHSDREFSELSVVPRHFHIPLLKRSAFDKRGFQCPNGTAACTALDPNVCCAVDETCQTVQDTGNGLGNVGCCPDGETCGGSLSACPSGYTSCPSNPGGGCCIPGYACYDVGCVLISTATVFIAPTTAATSTPSVLLSTTTKVVTSSTLVVVTPVTYTPSSPDTTLVASHTSISTTTITRTAASTSTITHPTCASGFRSCAPSLGGGCCSNNMVCGISTCLSQSSTISVVAPYRATSVKDTTTTTTHSSIPGVGCPTGYYACSAYYPGGCCQIGRDCAQTSCPASSGTTLVNSNSLTIIAPSGSGITRNPAGVTGSCASGWFSCAATNGGGCCPSGYGCGTSCTATASGGQGNVVGKVAPSNAMKIVLHAFANESGLITTWCYAHAIVLTLSLYNDGIRDQKRAEVGYHDSPATRQDRNRWRPFVSRSKSQTKGSHHAVADQSPSLNIGMDGPPGPQRSSQRRQPVADFTQPANSSNVTMNASSVSSTAPRTSSGSARSHSSRNLNQPDKQIAQIEKSVTHLLVATKQLLETLTQWSRKQAQEEEVSDVYVRLGYEFNLACRAFNSIGVETSDLGPVPDLLRSILEDTLSQPASPQSLDAYLPRIRDIIINLLHGLKRKQSKLRNRSNKDGSSSRSAAPSRQLSGTSLGSNDTGLTQMLEDVPNQPQHNIRDQKNEGAQGLEDQSNLPARNASAPATIDRHSVSNRQSLQRDVNRSVTLSDSSSSISSTTMQNMPVLPPYSDPEENPENAFPHPPPPPPPKQQDALAALQRGGELERRASRRFSSYQIQKHLGASPNGIPVIPAAQHSPIPNRGQHLRESREMMSAVKARGSYQHTRQKSNSRVAETSPNRNAAIKNSQRISEEREDDVGTAQKSPAVVIPPPSERPPLDSPMMRTPEDMYKPLEADISPVGATMSGPPTLPGFSTIIEDPKAPAPPPPVHHQPIELLEKTKIGTVKRQRSVNKTPPQSRQFNLEDSPPSGKELTLFLQYKSKIKKFVLSEGYEGLTIARLQLAFIEKFAWNTHNNGVDLPEIYIQDPVSGVRHELEDLSDVKDRSVLVLNIEALDEVKKHFDEGIGDIRKMLEGVRGVIDGQNTMMQRLGDRQLEASKEMARISVTPSRTAAHPTTPAYGPSSTMAPSAASLSEVQSLRRDIAVLRQIYANMSADFTASLDSIKTKGANVKSVAADAAIPTFEGNAGRAHVNKGKKELAHDSEVLVNHVDDLSDVVEDLRKDVVTRGVRPLPRQLENISKDISTTVKELAKMKDFLKREKPIWTKIWEQELNLVCTERDELTQQEDLMADLHGDLEDLTGVFKLVEEATRQQNLQNGTAGGGMRSSSRNISLDTEVDPHKAKDGVLGEVRALQPNHETRLEAIERAEKLRQKELESRKGGEFQREVESFVEEGKLRKTGGADEVERLRKLKDERARKENWERAQQRKAEMEAREAEEAAAAAAAAATAAPPHTLEDSNESEAIFEDASEHKPEMEPPNSGEAEEASNAVTNLVEPSTEQLEVENSGTSFLHD